jgi:hypothetical protein
MDSILLTGLNSITVRLSVFIRHGGIMCDRLYTGGRRDLGSVLSYAWTKQLDVDKHIGRPCDTRSNRKNSPLPVPLLRCLRDGRICVAAVRTLYPLAKVAFIRSTCLITWFRRDFTTLCIYVSLNSNSNMCSNRYVLQWVLDNRVGLKRLPDPKRRSDQQPFTKV